MADWAALAKVHRALKRWISGWAGWAGLAKWAGLAGLANWTGLTGWLGWAGLAILVISGLPRQFFPFKIAESSSFMVQNLNLGDECV